MSTGTKTVDKLRRKAKKVKKSIDAAWKESDKADKRPSVLAKSHAYSMARSQQRRYDRNFGNDLIAAKPLVAMNFTCDVARISYGLGTAIQVTVPAAIMTFAGFQPGDIIEFLKAGPALLGQYLKVLAVTSSTTFVVEDVVTWGAGVAEKTLVTTVADVAGSLNDTYFLLSSPTVNYYTWIDVAGAGTDPALVGKTGIHVAIPTGASAHAVAVAVAAAIDFLPAFVAPVPAGAQVLITNAVVGTATDAVDGLVPTGFTITTPVQGVATVALPSETGDYARLEASSEKPSFK